MIKMTDEILEKEMLEFKKAIEDCSGDEVTYKKKIGTVDRKAIVFFDPVAWLKMTELVRVSDKEIAWHGLAYRVDEEIREDSYIIEDIICHPQEVTGVTVTTEQAEYEKWLMELDDDTFNNMRMQGHSHVNMGVTPSGTDLALYSEYLSRLGDDDFYIFLIANKKGDIMVKVYDKQKNVFFDAKDVSTYIVGVDDFVSEAMEMVKVKTYNTPANKNTKPVADTKPSGKKKGKRVSFDYDDDCESYWNNYYNEYCGYENPYSGGIY